jgi:hypothetical protein
LRGYHSIDILKPCTRDETARHTSAQAGREIANNVCQRRELSVITFGDLDTEFGIEADE